MSGGWNDGGQFVEVELADRDLARSIIPDDHHPLMPRRNPEDIDRGAIKADLEFLIEWVRRFRKEQAQKPVYTMIGSAAIVIAWIELF